MGKISKQRARLFRQLNLAYQDVKDANAMFEGCLKFYNDEFRKFREDYIKNANPTAEKKAMYAYLKSLSPRLTELSARTRNNIPVILPMIDVLDTFLKTKKYAEGSEKAKSVQMMTAFVVNSKTEITKIDTGILQSMTDVTQSLSFAEDRSQ